GTPRRRARVVPGTDPPVLKVWLDATPGARGPRVHRSLLGAAGTRSCCRLSPLVVPALLIGCWRLDRLPALTGLISGRRVSLRSIVRPSGGCSALGSDPRTSPRRLR